VAKGAGVSKATIYRRYPNKMELVLASLEGALPYPEVPDTGSGLDDLSLMMKQIVRYGLTDRNRCLFGCMMLARSRHPELADAMKARIIAPRRARGRRLLQRAVDRGELPAGTSFELMLDMVFGPILVRHARGDLLTPEAAETLVAAVWSGMGGRS